MMSQMPWPIITPLTMFAVVVPCADTKTRPALPSGKSPFFGSCLARAS
jgi:hypothetical protein